MNIFNNFNRTNNKTIIDVLIYVCCLFPITTTLIDGTIINKLLFALLLCIYLVCVLTYGFLKQSFRYIIVLAINYLIAVCFTKLQDGNNINMFFYYPFMITFSCFILDNKTRIIDVLYRNKKFVLFIIRCWTIIVGISIFLPSSYYVKEGGSYYFGSFCGTIFRLGPAALFIMSLSLLSMIFYHRKIDIIYQVIPLYCVFMGSSRTYLISGLCIFIIAWYCYVGNRKKFWISFIPIALIGIFIIFNSSIGEKIRYTLDDSQYGDFWFRVTSSRSEFWAVDINGWLSQGIINKLFGSGIFFTENLTGIWAHNDFIEILCGFGLVGLILYCIIQFKLIRQLIKGGKKPTIVIICAVCCWLFNAFFNMYYTYFCSLLSYPFMLIAVGNMKTSNFTLDNYNMKISKKQLNKIDSRL